ncbi:hypothetical protein EAO69_07120 [Streptomyces sp. me109]|nr:hypothetical protein EAO69_07120 [Streptomyces sp. me109]
MAVADRFGAGPLRSWPGTVSRVRTRDGDRLGVRVRTRDGTLLHGRLGPCAGPPSRAVVTVNPPPGTAARPAPP